MDVFLKSRDYFAYLILLIVNWSVFLIVASDGIPIAGLIL
jgi:hypothetical protein